MLHDLRKMQATVGERLGLSSAVLHRILNHTAPKTDVLRQHYVGLDFGDVMKPMEKSQTERNRLCRRTPLAVT